MKKLLEFPGLLLVPWKFWRKRSFVPGNSAKLYDTSWERNQILCDFFLIAPENFTYFLFNPRKSHMLFFNITGKSKSWNSQFCDFT